MLLLLLLCLLIATIVVQVVRLSDSPVSYDRGPPLLGEHTDEVLAEQLGLDAARLAELRSKGII